MPANIVNSDSFWNSENEKLYRILYPEMFASAMLGADEGLYQGGLDSWTTAAELGVSWDVINSAAATWAEYATAELVTKINQTTMYRLQDEISQWIRESEHLDTLTDRIQKIYGGDFTEYRARLIAMTETTRAFATGNQLVWEDLPYIKGKRWVTANDERVCGTCGPLDATIVEISGNFEFVNYGKEEKPVLGVGNPPAHPGCRCSLFPFTDKAQLEAAAHPAVDTGQIEKQEEALKSEHGMTEEEAKERFTGTTRGRYSSQESFVNTPKNDRLRQEAFIDRGGSVYSQQAKGDAKHAIVSKLSEQTGIPYRYINDGIYQWAISSNDESYGSLHTQSRAAKMFGTKLSPWQQKKLRDVMDQRGKRDGNFYGNLRHYFEDKDGTLLAEIRAAGYNSIDDATDAFLTAMYKHTQDEFASFGIKEIYAYRGMGLSKEAYAQMLEKGTGTEIGLAGNALESWSIKSSEAHKFATTWCQDPHGMVIKTKIPVDRILGSARTGFGCLSEWEFVTFSDGDADRAIIHFLK